MHAERMHAGDESVKIDKCAVRANIAEARGGYEFVARFRHG